MEILLNIGKALLIIPIILVTNKICTKAIGKILDIIYERSIDD